MSFGIVCRNIIIIFLICITSTIAADKDQITTSPIDISQATELRVQPSLTTADTCIVRHDNGLAWQINDWVVGNELYKSYLDPSLSCPNPYPYTIFEVNMPMVFSDSTSITVSVDVEKVDRSNPGCPFPDSIISISSAYELFVPEAGVYNIWVPLDQPLQVNEPFFAGFFIGSISNTNSAPAVITDDDTLSICESYNIWDDTLGFIDLMNNQFFNFPGQLVLYVSGTPGGNVVEPEPDVKIISPSNNQELFGSNEIWVHEQSGSGIIEYVSFEYSDGGPFVEIGRDYDGTAPLRDGLNPIESGNGYSFQWDFSGLTEGVYLLRVESVDTLGRSATDSVSVFIEPTPPIPVISSPSYGSHFCTNTNILMTSADDNMLRVELYYKESQPVFSLGIESIDQGPFGNYYSAPIAAASCIQLWHDRGYTFLMKEGFNTLTIEEFTNTMAGYFNVTPNYGSYDEIVFNGLKEFNTAKGNALLLDYKRTPSYQELRTVVEYEETPVMVALGGSTGRWLAIDGFSGNPLQSGIIPLSVANPLSGAIETVQMRETGSMLEINLTGSWQPVDLLISVNAVNWDIARTLIGTDDNRLDGWLYEWNPSGLTDKTDYYIRAEGYDLNSLNGSSTIQLNYDCSQFFVAGDLNNDGFADINDLTYLINYYMQTGPPPAGDLIRADTNCDGYLNFTDIVYFANFIFGQAAPPCH